MYDPSLYAQMRHLRTEQHNSLEKHQRMIDGMLKWQRHQQPLSADAQPAMRLQLRPVLAAIVGFFVK